MTPVIDYVWCEKKEEAVWMLIKHESAVSLIMLGRKPSPPNSSHYYSKWLLQVSPLWRELPSLAVIAKSCPLITTHHQPFSQIICPHRVTPDSVFKLCSRGLHHLLCHLWTWIKYAEFSAQLGLFTAMEWKTSLCWYNATPFANLGRVDLHMSALIMTYDE